MRSLYDRCMQDDTKKGDKGGGFCTSVQSPESDCTTCAAQASRDDTDECLGKKRKLGTTSGGQAAGQGQKKNGAQGPSKKRKEDALQQQGEDLSDQYWVRKASVSMPRMHCLDHICCCRPLQRPPLTS